MKIITSKQVVFETKNSDELHDLEGHIFKGSCASDNEFYMFVQVGPGEYNFIGLTSGNRHTAPFKSIESFKAIGMELLYTNEEFHNILKIGGIENGK